MAVTPSNMLPLGTKAPEFELFDTVSKRDLSLEAMKSDKATVIFFICNHCPFVKHIQSELVNLAHEYQAKGVSFIAISSNDASEYPEDSSEQMTKVAMEKGYPFPYLYDEAQVIAKMYDAACTPDFYIFDGNLSLVYRGQLDDSRPGNGVPVTGKDIRQALDHLLAGEPVSQDQKPSTGCNIKWIK